MMFDDSHTSEVLKNELDWLEALVHARLNAFLEGGSLGNVSSFLEAYPAPSLVPGPSVYVHLCRQLTLNEVERMLIALALVPHLRPALLDVLYIKHPGSNRQFTEFGGLQGVNHNGFLPTGETAAFLVAGQDLRSRIELLAMLGKEGLLLHKGILQMESPPSGEPELSAALQIAPYWLGILCHGKEPAPEFGPAFPARKLETALSWEDMVLPHDVAVQLAPVRTWLAAGAGLLTRYEFNGNLKPGYRALFYGPPGTGKTLAASLLGKDSQRPVFQIDASMVVSKWVGETEKNLAKVFDVAEHKDWILFFDEADALFGKRGGSSGGHERHGNQQVAYLLQRTENYPGTVILATNLMANIDEAFLRRFQSMIYFPVPETAARERLWNRIFKGIPLSDDVDFRRLAEEYEVSGGSMVNVLKYGLLHGEQRGDHLVQSADLVEGIRLELRKRGGI